MSEAWYQQDEQPVHRLQMGACLEGFKEERKLEGSEQEGVWGKAEAGRPLGGCSNPGER